MFRNLNIKPSYYTDEGNIAQDFYNPVLSHSIQYNRVSGYFSAKALAAYSQGIQGLIHNGGKMRLIISHEISEADYDLIKEGYKLRENLESELLNRLNEPLSLTEQKKKKK